MDNALAAELFTAPASEALRAFPIEPDRIDLVTVSENVTFRVAARDGDYVLRLHRPGYHSLEELDSERLWTQALTAAGIAVPLSVAARDGRFYVPAPVPATGETRFAGVVRWTHGEVLADVMERIGDEAAWPAWFEQLGAILASMHNQAGAWSPPSSFTRHHLDVDGLLGEAPFWGRFWESPVFNADQRALVLATRETIRDVLGRYGRSPQTYSVIHADLHPGNILIDDGRLTVIDFDDAGFGWHMYDVAVVLFYHQRFDTFPVLRETFFRGYRSLRPLSAHDEAMLPLFLLVRGLAQIGWYAQRPELAREPYLSSLMATRDRVCGQCADFTPPPSLAKVKTS